MISDPILAGGSPVVGIYPNASFSTPTMQDLERQKQEIIELQKRMVAQKGRVDNSTPIWDKIDAEVAPLTEDQRKMMMNDKEYATMSNQIAELTQNALLQLVKPYVEASEEGKELLNKMLDVTKRVKGAVLTQSQNEMEFLRAFAAAASKNPDLTMAEFRKSLKADKK